ncbi:MAG: inorganic pyrophosphatase [Candidatus Dadabacteria bacterium]
MGVFPPPYYRWRPHPWHGLEVGPNPPKIVHAYIEITPFDGIKYEVDKTTGYIRVDRPQRTSSQPPALYGFIPRTYCGKRVGKLSPNAHGGDGDPLDICVFSERPITRSEVILNARVVGGLQGIDGGLAVLEKDNLWGEIEDISEMPAILVERLRHYFSTYKLVPGTPSQMIIEGVYNCEHALQVVEAAMEDYNENYGA